MVRLCIVHHLNFQRFLLSSLAPDPSCSGDGERRPPKYALTKGTIPAKPAAQKMKKRNISRRCWTSSEKFFRPIIITSINAMLAV